MSEVPVISVTELVAAFKEVVETALPACCVEAEISNCRRSAAGHYYLTLKDESSEIGAVIWRSTAESLKFRPADGLKVRATGSLQVYAARGSCQFMIRRLEPQGTGELELAFRRLHEKLRKEGLFDADRKRPLPARPRRVVLVTSPTSAAVRDMIQVMTRRWPGVRLAIIPVRVQGEGAAREIAKGLGLVREIADADVVITGRGGGSLEDLWAFNEEIVARAIAACPVPVVSAVGHEIDVTIADLVADRRALTPSEAGELVVPDSSELSATLRQTAARLSRGLQNHVRQARALLEGLETRPVMRHPMMLVEERRQTADELSERMARAFRNRVLQSEQKLAASAAALEALSPLKVLARGYSLTQKLDGTVIRSVKDVDAGDELSTRLPDGEFRSTVTPLPPSDTTGAD